jgi:hypothetical protein
MRRRVLVVVAALAVSTACSKGDDSLAKKAGSKLGETVTDFASGVGKGVDRQMVVEVDLGPSVVEKGLTKTIAKSSGLEGPKEISVYLVSSAAVKGVLVAKALDEKGGEIGRASESIEFTADDAKYVTFKFQEQMDSQLVKRFVLEFRK